MKRKAVCAGLLLALCICAVLLYSFFHVGGQEIGLAEQISGGCTVTVAKYRLLEWEDREEYVLNQEQIGRLRELILKSSFTRTIGKSVTIDSRDMYDITVDFGNGQDFLSIHCIGGEYISVTNQFGGHHLKIKNDGWQQSLEEIIAGAEG